MPASNGGFISSYDSFPNGSSYTFLVRIRQPELQDNACIFGTPGGHALIARNGGTELAVYANTYAVQAAHNVPAGQFYNVVMDYDAATNLTRLWVNNVMLGQGQGNGPNMGEYAILFLNTYSYGSFAARSLQYGEVVLYNTILSDSSRAAWHAYLLTR
ncbi:LamG-like jellyroll fold domain-containing protein [Hymenobacter canadensis]|uniref:LamG domain-containing protein n=1 Tax=Hymenobacter canadensis TaxID=2999067 RepID=A0ABY7LVN3_9BACT|nr:LamG-like jellyroll fold domain-containing protein [Hymenobacter canadensis]WBA42968.1 hypothetical protein O3303_05240 [Hymenobacter canadensis]